MFYRSKSFARLENNFLNISDIVYGSNVKPFSASRQILVEGDLLSGKPNCFNVFQSFFGFFVFSFSLFSKYAFFFLRIKFWTTFRASL